MATDNSTATTPEEIKTGLPPDILEHFYDLRALAMNASAMTVMEGAYFLPLYPFTLYISI